MWADLRMGSENKAFLNNCRRRGMIPRVTTKLSRKGRVIIRQRVRISQNLRAGARFTVTARSNGDILLRPLRRRKRYDTLADNLLALRGVELAPDLRLPRDF
jgi:bifunctional DNA-binding transcriptional regulator/antitoxin component of YhaV-PrlF toxin-antitoxin module